jgi:hypothetical protein
MRSAHCSPESLREVRAEMLVELRKLAPEQGADQMVLEKLGRNPRHAPPMGVPRT